MRKLMVLLAMPLALSLAACSVIEPGQVGVRVSLGQMDKQLLQPGLQTYNPFTDQINEYSTKQETVEGKCVPLTSDQQAITIDYKAQYHIPASQVLTLYSQYNGDPYAKLVDPQVQEAFRQVVSQYKADAATKNLNTIRTQVLAMVRENVKGLVDVSDIPITHVTLPQILQDAIAQKQVMEQQALQKTYELQKAQQEANITVANAKAEAESTKLQAEAEATKIRLQTEAISKSPALIEYERVKHWDGKLPNTLITGGNGGSFANLINVK